MFKFLREPLRKWKQSEAYGLTFRFFHFKREFFRRRAYFSKIDKMIENKKVVISIRHGGLGDVLAFSSLPRLLKEQKSADFYLAESSRNVFRHPDFFKICFEMNPYFKGFAPDRESIEFIGYDRHSFLFPRAKNLAKMLESQFQLKGSGLPEIFYKPKLLEELTSCLLIDKNMIAGVTLNWNMNHAFMDKIIEEARSKGKEVRYVNPKEQNIFTYADMIHSSWKFTCMFSGSHALAVALGKPAHVIVPENFDGGGIMKFIYPSSVVSYYRSRSMRRYMKANL